ncbi:hypothetical protein AK88_01027 [Plasmodium fragile]|uniref:Uncharacterized protein n=1 Tax=Plasmodium fragile TaxID=5857 RepID=A0A0D9QTW4_PLAFR|nr:uncharacterized protein AK88_01027 [Plasmodium fragile]KJP89361.1 hypothetical protein AK88_01027 [Plasmodium fragile]
MKQVESSKSKGNCVGPVASCPQHDNCDKGNEGGGRLKREKIKNICNKINHLKRTVCSSTDYFKCVEILFQKAGSKCDVPKRRKKHAKCGEGTVFASPEKGIFFKGKINHLDLFDTPKLCAFFEKHATEVVQGAVHAEDHFAKHKDTLTNGNQFVCSLREEPLFVQKTRLPSGGEVPVQTFRLTGKDSNGCNKEWDKFICNANSTCTTNYAHQSTWMNSGELAGQSFTKEGKTEADNAPQDNKRKNKHVNDAGDYCSFNKRMKLSECERDANANSVSHEQLQVDAAHFAPGQHGKWNDSPRGTRMKWVMQDVPTSYLQQRSTITEEGPARKKILMLKVSSIMFNHEQGTGFHLRPGNGALKKGNQLITPENLLEGRKSNQCHDGNAAHMIPVPTDEAKSGLTRKFFTDDELEDELQIKEDIQFVYNLFCILAVHMNSLFSMCTQLLRYNFSDLGCENNELSSESKRLIKLIRDYQREERFVIQFAKCILSVRRGGETYIGKGSNKDNSQRGSKPSRRGTIAHLEMKTLKKIIKTLLKWEQEDENIQIMLTQNRVQNQANTFKIEIMNHRMVKQNLDMRKLYFCKYNGELLAFLKRLSTVHSQSNWGSTEGEKNDVEGIHTRMDKLEGDTAQEVAPQNGVNVYVKCVAPMWKTTKGETGEGIRKGIELNEDAEKELGMGYKTGLCKTTDIFHSTNESNDGCFGEDQFEEGADNNNTPLEVLPNGQTNLTTNQVSVMLYLNKILTNEIRHSEDLRIRAKREVEQTEILLWEVKRLQEMLRRSGTDVKNSRTSERVLYKMMQMETRSAEFFSHQDGKDMHLMEQTTFDENEMDQAIWRRDTELFNVTNDAHDMGGNPSCYVSAEGDKCVKNRLYHLDDCTKGDLITTLPPNDGNIYKVRHMIGKIFDQLVKFYVNKSYANASHPCDKDVTSKIDVEKKGGQQILKESIEPTEGVKKLIEELDKVKKENSQFAEFLEREKRLAAQLGLEVERQNKALMEMELQLESERKRNEELKVHVEREELVNNELLSQMEEERKVGSEAKEKLAELAAELTEVATELEREKERSDSLEAELAEEKDKIISLETELEKERGRVASLETELEGEKDKVASLEEEKERLSAMKEELQAEREASALMFAQMEKQREQLTQQEEEMTKMRKRLEEQTEKSDPSEVSHSSEATNELGGDKKGVSSLGEQSDKERMKQSDKERMKQSDKDRMKQSDKDRMKQSEGKKLERVPQSTDPMQYGQLYDEFVETMVEKESLEKENELMMNHFNEQIGMLGEQAKYFDHKIRHYKSLCESYERTNMQVGQCMKRMEEMIKEIEVCPDLSDVNLEEKINKIKKVANDMKDTYAMEEKVGTENLLFDEIIMEKNILMKKILHLETEIESRMGQTTGEGQVCNRMDLPNEEMRKYMEEMNFKSFNDLFTFHLNILNELNVTKECYNQLVEENLMKAREYQSEIARLKKLVKDKEFEIGVSDENCKSLLLEVENLKFILNDLFSCGGGRVRATQENNSPVVQDLPPSVQEIIEHKLSPHMRELSPHIQNKVEQEFPPAVQERVEEELCPSVQKEVEQVFPSVVQELFPAIQNTVEEELPQAVHELSPAMEQIVAQEKVEQELSPVVKEGAEEEKVEEASVTSVLEEESIVAQNASHVVPSEPQMLPREVSSVAAPQEDAPAGDVLSSVASKPANDTSLQNNPVSADSQNGRNARSGNAAANAKGRRATPRNRTTRGKKATSKGDTKEDGKGANTGERQSRTETKTNKGTSGNKNSRGNKSRAGSKSVQAESGNTNSGNAGKGNAGKGNEGKGNTGKANTAKTNTGKGNGQKGQRGKRPVRKR